MTAQNLKTAFTLMNNEKNLKKRAPADSDIKTYTFKKFVYEAPYFPHYEEYRDHEFIIDHPHPDPEASDHVWLICVTNRNVRVKGYVELDQLEETSTVSIRRNM